MGRCFCCICLNASSLDDDDDCVVGRVILSLVDLLVWRGTDAVDACFWGVADIENAIADIGQVVAEMRTAASCSNVTSGPNDIIL